MGVREDTGNKKWCDYWRHYKTKKGAQAYAKKHRGVWVIIYCDKSLMTKEELEDLGQWIVGRADEYLFFKNKHGQDFEKLYKAIEYWKDGNVIIVIPEDGE